MLSSFRSFDEEDFDAIDRLWREDARITAPPGWPEPGPFEGRAAVMEQLARLASDMGAHRTRDVEIVADRGGWVVLSYIWEVRGAGSGAPISSKLAVALQIVDGRFACAHYRWTPEQALGAAGLG